MAPLASHIANLVSQGTDLCRLTSSRFTTWSFYRWCPSTSDTISDLCIFDELLSETGWLVSCSGGNIHFIK